jgi:secretion/DNA translocation related TadE-like protein
VVAVAMIAVLVAVTTGALCLGSAVIARHRAQAAADLAALAAARRLADGPDAACAQATAIARAMKSAIAQCTVDGVDVVVAANVLVTLGKLGMGTASASARAGPLDTRRPQ